MSGKKKKRTKKRSSVQKGDAFEERTYEILNSLLKSGKFLFASKSCAIFRKKKYYSEDRKGSIEVDISIEVYIDRAPEWSILCVIECKDYSKSVPVDDVEEFESKIGQIAGKNVKGWMVTSANYQKSALNFAESRGIGLIRILPDNKIRWERYRGKKRRTAWNVGDKQDQNIAEQALTTGKYVGISNFIFAFENGNFFSNLSSFISKSLSLANEPRISNSEIFLFLNSEKKAPNKLPYISQKEIDSLCEEILTDINPNIIKKPLEVPIPKLLDYIDENFNCKVIENEDLGIDGNGEDIIGKISFNPNRIYISNSLESMSPRWRFTLAHEIGHLILHGNYIWADEEREDSDQTFRSKSDELQGKFEMQANFFAAALLLPKISFMSTTILLAQQIGLTNKGHGLIYLDHQYTNIGSYLYISTQLMTIFKTSRTSIKYRLKQLGLLKEPEKPEKKHFFRGFQ